MATSPASQVYSPQVLGDAVLLGSGLNPLRVLQQEGGRVARERAAAARLKQQQDASAAKDVVPLTADGWLPHNEELTAAVKAGYEQQQKIYADPGLSPFEKKQQALQIQGDLKQMADRSNELKKRYDETIALASDPRYDKQKLEASAYNSYFRVDPATNERKAIPLREYDPNVQADLRTNSDNFNQDEVLKRFIKSEADSENDRLGKAAAPGGYGSVDAASSNIFEVKNGQVVLNADGSPHIRDISALLQRAHRDPFMASILRGNSAKAQQAAGVDAMSAGGPDQYAPLTPEQQLGLAALPDANVAQRVDLANLVSDYGRTKTSRMQTYRALPRPSAGSSGGKEKYTQSDPNQGGFGRVGLSTANDGTRHADGTQTDRSTSGMSSAWRGVPPTRTSVSTGKPEPYTRDNVTFKRLFVQQPGGNAVLEPNNMTSQSMQFGAITHVLTTRSGQLIRATSEADNATPEALEAWYKRARAQYPDAKSGWVVEATPKKGQNSYANDDEAYKDLYKSNEEQDGGKTPAELRSKAHKLVAEQNATYFVPYEGDNARQLNSYTKNYYEQGRAAREAFQRDYDGRTAPGKGAAPAAKAVTGPAALMQSPRAAAPAATTTKSAAATTGAGRFRNAK